MVDDLPKLDQEEEDAEGEQQNEGEGNLVLDAAETEEVRGGGYPPLNTYTRSNGGTG
jgi:hypothetical protein